MSSPHQVTALVAAARAPNARERAKRLERRIEDALLRYQVGLDIDTLTRWAAPANLVDWRYVAERMAKVLRGEDDEDASSTVSGGATTSA